MSIFITAYQNRDTRESIAFTAVDGSQPALGGSDKVRIKIGRAGHSPLIDLVSGSPLSGGTSVTAANPAILEFAPSDLASIKAGVYDIEAMVVDHADSDRAKMAEAGVFSLIGTQGGGIT